MISQIAFFAVTLAALLALSRWISRQVQILGLRLTGDERIALLTYYLLLLPGIVLHELSHVVMAKLLGLRVGRFSLGPKPRGRYVELGSVQVSSGGALRDSLVGLAPFLTGTVVLLLVGYQVFNVGVVGRAWLDGGWGLVWQAIDGIWRTPDFWLWAYVVFAVSNAMIPSPADRQPWLLAGLYVGLALVAAYLLGGLSLAADALGPNVAGAIQVLTLAFLFTVVLDFAAAALLFLADVVIISFQQR